jgi:isopentenyl-diphosphate delta-isomerase
MPAAQSKRAAVGIGNTMGDNVPSHHVMSDHAYRVQPAHDLQGDHELFDVVDEEDRVFGRMRRDDVHRWQLRHRAAHVLVVNSHGEVFVQRRSALKECAPGLWDTSVAGHVKSGESYAACAVRELAEEIGLQRASPLCQVGYLKASPDTGWEFVAVFLCGSDGPLVLCPEEIAEGRWASPETLAQWMIDRPEELTTTFRLIWARSREWLRDSQRPTELPPVTSAHG